MARKQPLALRAQRARRGGRPVGRYVVKRVVHNPSTFIKQHPGLVPWRVTLM